MVNINTSLKKIKRFVLNLSRGFSLLELLITLAIFGILMVIITSILLINLTVARRVKARTYAREESAFMLNILKKDIRNAESVAGIGTNLKVAIIEEDLHAHCYRWFLDVDGERYQIERREINCTDNSDMYAYASYRTPSDVEFSDFSFKVIENDGNSVVTIKIVAWTTGMPGEPDRQLLTKEVAVSTRNFDFD